MSTERKPGSRGVTTRFAGGHKQATSPPGSLPDTDENERRKGTTRTQSPSKGYKKKKKRR